MNTFANSATIEEIIMPSFSLIFFQKVFFKTHYLTYILWLPLNIDSYSFTAVIFAVTALISTAESCNLEVSK